MLVVNGECQGQDNLRMVNIEAARQGNGEGGYCKVMRQVSKVRTKTG